MADYKIETQPRKASRRESDPRIPHPSWRQTIGGEQDVGRIANAGEFWERLGI